MAEHFDGTYDLVVVGAGASGLSAAVEATKNGNSVAVLEKLDTVGGRGQFIEGTAAFESSEQKKRGIEVTRVEGFDSLMDESHWRADARIVSAFVSSTAATIDKLSDIGVQWDRVDNYDTLPYATFHWPDGEGARVVTLMDQAARQGGADIFVSTTATRLLMEAGRVIGLEATDSDGEPLRLGAGAVILAGGGYAASVEMMRKHWVFGDNARYLVDLGTPGNTGDGMSMAAAVGAATATTGAVALLPVARGKAITSQVSAAGLQPSLWVDTSGRRYTNEAVVLNFSNAANVIAQRDQGTSFTIFDAAAKRHLQTDGPDVGLGTFTPLHSPLDKLDAELEHDLTTDTAYQADTLAELATQIGADAATLAATVDRYNELVRAGDDADLYKPAEYLRPVDRGPFYAVRMAAGILISLGGITVTPDFQVVRGDDHEPIPGLYAVGADASGIVGDTYPLKIGGTISGYSLTSGWLAADHASRTVLATA